LDDKSETSKESEENILFNVKKLKKKKKDEHCSEAWNENPSKDENNNEKRVAPYDLLEKDESPKFAYERSSFYLKFLDVLNFTTPMPLKEYVVSFRDTTVPLNNNPLKKTFPHE
jgi:hypothetical protein